MIYGLPRSPMQLGLLRRGDWLGIALMAVGLAALQTVLDDGNVYDWFGSPFIVQAEPDCRGDAERASSSSSYGGRSR